MNAQSNQELIESLAKSDRHFERHAVEFFNRFAGKLFSRFSSNGFSPHDAEELSQDTLLKFLNTVKDSKGKCTVGLLWSIAKSTAIDRARSDHAQKRDKSKDVNLESVSFSLNSKETRGNEELVGCIDNAANIFRERWPNHFDTLRLAIFEEWNPRELSEFLGRSYGATRQYIFECKKKFREIVLRQCVDYLEQSGD